LEGAALAGQRDLELLQLARKVSFELLAHRAKRAIVALATVGQGRLVLVVDHVEGA
jgi:hypothetical protein